MVTILCEKTFSSLDRKRKTRNLTLYGQNGGKKIDRNIFMAIELLLLQIKLRKS